MNRQCYRLVFNTLRNLLMPVAELTGSYQRSASTRPGAGQARPCCWAWRPLALALLLLSLPGAALAQILADPAAPAGQRPTILNTASGAVQINIQTPSAGGVSMNQYRQFDTTTPVTIFNNGRSASQTQSAGWVAGNPWLAGGSARVIVNQVNSANPSRLSGTMEIAGARADLIIANPSGLRIDGITVLNANRSTFAAATPQLAGGVVQGFQTGNGMLQINGAGLNDSGSDYTTILARAVQLNAGLWAQQLQLSTGQNQLDATGKLIATTTPAAGSDGAAPAYSLDVAAIGGMYAGKITLLATEHGLGARNAGELVASQGDLQLQADGRLINTGRMLAQQGGSLLVQSQGLDNDGTLSASRNLHIASGPLSNSGLINAGRELVLNTSDIRNSSSGSISGQRVQIDADSLDNAGQLSQTGQQGLLLQANDLHSSGVIGLPPKASTAPELPSTPDDGTATPPATDSTNAPGGDAPVYSQPTPAEVLADGAIRVAGQLDNSGSLLANGGIDLNLQQGLQNHGSMQLRTLQLFGPMLDNRQGRLYVDQAHIDTGAIHNQGGTLVARQDITLRTATLNNQQGKLAAAGGLSLMTGQLDNRAGWLEAAGLLFNGGDIDNRQGGIFARDISASSGTVDNRGGLLAASQSLQLDTGGQTLWNADSGDTLGVLSGGRLALKTGDLFNLQDGRIQASTLDINSSTLRDLAGLIVGDTVTLQGDTLDNQAGLIAAKTSLSLVAVQSLHNQGELHSLGDAAVQADTLQQQGGLTTASRNLAVQARQLGSTGQFVAGQDLTLNTRQDLTVQAAIQAGRNLVLSTTGKLDNQSSLRAGGSASIQADSISNASQADITASTLNLQATTSLDNQGLIDAGDASLLAGQAISNRGSGRIYADRLLLVAPQLDNTPLAGQAPVIAARQQLGIATEQLLNGENAQLISLGDMVIGGFDDSGQINRPASLVDNQSASIEAGGNMQISADTVRNQRLRVGISQQSSIDETVTMNLPGWKRNGHNGGDLRNSANYRASQIYFVDPADIISNEQIITPDGNVLGRAVVKLSPQTSTFFFANGRGWGMTGERWRINIDQPQTQTIYYTLRQDGVVNPDQSPDGLDPFLLLHGPGGTGGAPYFSYQTDAVHYDAQYGSCSSHCVLLITPYQLTDPIHTVINPTGLGTTEPYNELRRTAHHSALDDVLTADTGAAPTIRAGGNMLLQPGQLLDNQYGQISAADQLQIDGGTASQIINTAATLYRNHHFDVTSHTYAGGSFANPQPDIRETIGSVDASIQGKTSLIINADTVANLDQGRPGPSPIAPPAPGSEVARLSQTSNGTVQLEPGSNGIPGSVLTQPPAIQLPRSSLYRLLPDGPAPLLETDPALTNRQAWLGSDYLLAGLSPDPNTSLKRLGDGYVEQQLINQQISRLTGQSLLAGYSDGQAQFRALMDNGKTFAASHQLVPGVALTAAQMAQLTSDIVWLVSQTVTLPDGRSQQVLVPQVYVKLQQGDLAPSGAILAADRLQLQLKGDLGNQGSIAGRQLLSINADTIHNLAGRLQGGDLAIHANTDLNNQGGRIQADHSLSLSAGRDLTSASTTYSQQHGSGGNTLQQTALDRMAGLYLGQGTGPMLLAAGRNLDLSGSQLNNQSSGSTVLSAGQDLTIGTTDTTQQRRITWNANNWSAQASTDQTGSRLSTQGDLTLQAGRNLAATAATLDSAQGQVQLQAGQDLTLASGQQTQQLDWQSHSSKKGWLSRSSSDDSYQGAQSWAKGSQINAGNGLTLQAGQDLNLQGSLLTSAQGQANLIAGRDINMEAGQNTDRYQQQSSSSDSKLFRSSQRADQSSVARTTLHPSELAAQQINIQAGRDLNLSASNLQAEQGLTASAQRDLNLTTQTTHETRSAAHQENSRGFSFSLLSGLQYGGNRGQDLGNFTATQQTGSTLSGQNVQLSAGHDATLQAATVLADQNLHVQAGRNVNILSATNTLASTSQASSSSSALGLLPGVAPRWTLFGTTASKENGTQPSTTQSTSLLSANSGNLTVLAGADKQYTGTGQGNLLSQGANLQAKQTATLQGNAVTLDAITNQDNNQYHQESKSFTIGSQLSGSMGSVITGIYDAAQAARHTSNARLQGALALKAGYDAYKLANGGIGTALKAEDTMNALNKASTEAGKGTVNNNSAAFAVSATVGSNRSSQDSSSSSTTQRGTIVQADTLNITASDGNLSATGAKLQATDINLSTSKDILLQAATNTAEVHNQNQSSNASAGATFGFGQQNGISFQLGVGQSRGVANGSETSYDNTLVTASNQLNLHSGNDTTLFGAQLAGNTVNADVGGKLAITTRQDQSQYESHQSSSGFDLSVCVPPICYGQFVSGSVNLAAQDINHDYQSATGQSGIAAGSGGFNLNVAGNTSLTGAAITSQASAEHNTLTTGSLSYQDLDNHQRTDASATSIGISAGNGSTLLSNVMSNLAANALGNAGLPKNNDESSQTKSVISPASVTITSGDAQSQAAANTLTARDASTANGALTNSLTLQQAQQLQQQLKDTQDTIKAAQIIGDIGRDITNSISQQKRDEADKILASSSDPADRAAALAMKQQYGTGGDFQRAGQAISAAIQGLVGGDMKGAVTDAAAPYLAQVVKQMTTDADGNTNLAANAMAHAALGALLAAAKGQNTTAGAVGGGIAPITADLVMNQLYPGKTVAELNEEQKQTVAALTTLTGTLAGGLTTGNSAGAVTGGQVANNEVLNNYLTDKQDAAKNTEKAGCKGELSCLAKVKLKYALISGQQEIGRMVGVGGGIGLQSYQQVENVVDMVRNWSDTQKTLVALVNDPAFRSKVGDSIVQDYRQRIDLMTKAYNDGGWDGSVTSGVEAGRLAVDVVGAATAAMGAGKVAVTAAKAGANVAGQAITKTAAAVESSASGLTGFNQLLKNGGLFSSNGQPLMDFRQLTSAQKSVVGDLLGSQKVQQLIPGAQEIGRSPGIGQSGIDGLYKVNKPGVDYVVIEYKFGSSKQSMTLDGLQGSDSWLSGANTNYNRILESVGGDRKVASNIRSAMEDGRFEKWLVHTDPFGRVTVGVMGKDGKLIPNPEATSKLLGSVK